MELFDAVCHSFATMATGGFSTRSASIAAYSSTYIQVVIIIFMFLAGVNFSLHFRALHGDIRCFYRDPEFRFYLVVWLGACFFLSFNVWGRDYASLGHALRAGFFQGTSILTTTGFCTENFDAWSNAARILLVLLMFIGGCAGSTGGGMKNIRVFVMLKKVMRELKRFLKPSAVVKIKLGGKPLDQLVVSHISAFFVMFVLIFALVTFVMTFYTPDLETAFSSVIASLGNIGPGLAGVGAVHTYADIPAPGKAILTFCMLLGRLELYTVMVLFVPRFWRR
jgi:trk system potassium uptake protein TrkH